MHPKLRVGFSFSSLTLKSTINPFNYILSWLGLTNALEPHGDLLEENLYTLKHLGRKFYFLVHRRNTVYRLLIANTIKRFIVVEKNLEGSLKRPYYTLLWHNMNILNANKPLEFKPWTTNGINVIGDLYNECGTSLTFLAHLFF